MNCVFCEEFIKKHEKIYENKYAIAYFDEFPVNKGHILIISKRHAETFFNLSNIEQRSMISLLNKCKKYIDNLYCPDGYNIGLNCGKDAGQTVMHVHLHLIPRYKGDVDDPKGGIRSVIPSKKNY